MYVKWCLVPLAATLDSTHCVDSLYRRFVVVFSPSGSSRQEIDRFLSSTVPTAVHGSARPGLAPFLRKDMRNQCHEDVNHAQSFWKVHLGPAINCSTSRESFGKCVPAQKLRARLGLALFDKSLQCLQSCRGARKTTTGRLRGPFTPRLWTVPGALEPQSRGHSTDPVPLRDLPAKTQAKLGSTVTSRPHTWPRTSRPQHQASLPSRLPRGARSERPKCRVTFLHHLASREQRDLKQMENDCIGARIRELASRGASAVLPFH